MTCHFCGREIRGLLPDRSVDGRAAHWSCSFEAWKAGEWVTRDDPVWGLVEEDDDERAAYYLNGGTDQRSYR